ncbi:VHS domain-containing protein [Mortierella sp. GBAus27b]|nr:VHS domain-containing protein [Mortierella sp. GBAus27b]
MNLYAPQPTVLESYIERACDPLRFEPDLALNLEICDYIKEKQKNTPREAAVYIVRLVNNRNMHVAMMALALLDNCVKNCGYPFHLQISTKEFLNELVRKFPERPLAVPTPVQTRILEMIQEWYLTICKTSRYKEDLVHIKDMHRLLSFKGYRFPQVKNDSASVLNPTTVLKSATELEEEDRAAQAAKLQELIRRGRPEDVLAANELVKKMTGFEQEDKPDYVEEASSELDKIMEKAILLTEMLNGVKPGESIGRGDAFEELLSACKAAQPKIQKFISEDEEGDNIEKLLQINDIINNVIEHYKQVKSGNLTRAAIPSLGQNEAETRARSGTTSSPSQKESSLIDLVDFGGPNDNTQSTSTSQKQGTGNLMDDLMNLNFNDEPPPAWGAMGSINLGRSTTPSFSGSGLNPTRPPIGPPPGYSGFPAIGGSLPDSGTGSPAFANSPQLTHQSALQSTSSRSSTPGYPPQGQPTSSSTTDSAFDDFDFVSNTGAAPTGPTTVTLLNKNGLLIELDVEYPDRDASSIQAVAHFSNSLNSPMTMLTFRVAVPKSLQLQLNPQSSQAVAPFSKRTVSQSMSIKNPTRQQPIRIRYQVSYSIEGRTIEEQGEFNQFPSI